MQKLRSSDFKNDKKFSELLAFIHKSGMLWLREVTLPSRVEDTYTPKIRKDLSLNSGTVLKQFLALRICPEIILNNNWFQLQDKELGRGNT